jgi:lysozyme family protein
VKQNFNKSLEMLLKHEGGYVNHPRDPGGMTNLGVTKRVYEAWVDHEVDEAAMRALTPDDVAPIYRANYWDAVWGDHLPSGVDFSVFDWAVNSGPARAIKALQRIVGSVSDGIMGPKTMQAVMDMDAEKIIDLMHGERQRFYERLDTFDTFGRGWTRRNNETRQAALLMAD